MTPPRAGDVRSWGANGPDAQRVEWLEQLAAATQLAIGRLGELDDPAHTTLVHDLQGFYDRLLAQLGR
jgi:hypothetical protein